METNKQQQQPTKQVVDTMFLPTSSRDLLTAMEVKFAELSEILQAIGQDYSLLAKGIKCKSKMDTQEMAGGKVKMKFDVTIVLPAVKVDVTI